MANTQRQQRLSNTSLPIPLKMFEDSDFKCTPANTDRHWQPSPCDVVTLVEQDKTVTTIILLVNFLFFDQMFVKEPLVLKTRKSGGGNDGGGDKDNKDNKENLEAVGTIQMKDFTTADAAKLIPHLFDSRGYSEKLKMLYLEVPILRTVLDLKRAPLVCEKVLDNEATLTYRDMFGYMDKTVCWLVSKLPNDPSTRLVEVFFSDAKIQVHARDHVKI